FLNNQEHLLNAANYIDNNHLKHGIYQLEYKFKNLTPLSDAFKPKIVKGGFDVVIGNPPYVDFRAIEENQKEYLVQKYHSTKVKEKWSLFIPFLEKSTQLINNNGKFGYIIPNNFLVSDFGLEVRKYLLNN